MWTVSQKLYVVLKSEKKPYTLQYHFVLDVTKTGNGERESGNKCAAVTRLRIQNGGGNDVYKH